MIGAIWRKELLDIIRDRRTLMSMIVVPILLMPVLILGVGAVMAAAMQKLEAQNYTVAMLYPENSPRLEEALLSIENTDFVDLSGTHPDTVRSLVREGDFHAAVIFPEDDLTDADVQPPVTLISRQDREKSQIAAKRIELKLDEFQKELVSERLAQYDTPETVLEPFKIVEENLASDEQQAMSALAGFLPYILIIITLTGAMYPAIDMTAGEKERGTLETLLASPAGRLEIVLGKFMAVFTTSVVSAVLSLTSLIVMLLWGITMLASQFGAVLDMTFPSKAILAGFGMMLPLAALFSSLLITICLFAKSTREAQSYIQPLMFLIIIPAMMSLMPGSEGAGGDAWTPVVNISLALKGILTDNYNPSFIGQTILATVIYAGIGIFIAFKTFQRESVLFRV